ncbi:hypothetical protein [Shewanella cyperi]|uniref:hypothetical protein n=1 Tax=Shewanella cyperi TaxID=2814292 RepID=UPI001A9429EF|nr:hypothetical protein [Shewanella cyperi]QSX41967.1 hypothetical protein JYB84_06020 [Shewanella cyperi]
MTTISLPEDGKSICIYGEEVILSHANLKSTIVLKYIFEPPHGDALFELYINEKKESENLYWGRGVAISVGGRFLAITRNLHGILTTVFDLHNMKRRDVTGFVHLLGFDKDLLLYQPYLSDNEKDFFKFEHVQKICLNELTAWTAIEC